VEGDSIDEKASEGYLTVWKYYYARQNNQVDECAMKNCGLILRCGNFSYSQLPNDFAYITGVTGTLSCLAQFERDILEHQYDICAYTFMPSIYSNASTKSEDRQLFIETDEQYYDALINNIMNKLDSNRPVLVFFEDKKQIGIPKCILHLCIMYLFQFSNRS
jgi:hypothetical protein